MENELDGLKYDSLLLDNNVHKITGTITKLQDGKTGEIKVDDGAIWVVTGLGYLKEDTPDKILQDSFNDIIIVSKSQLIEFIKNKK